MDTELNPVAPISLCNDALQLLGVNYAIFSLDPRISSLERACASLYHPTRRIVLCDKNWEFARRTWHSISTFKPGGLWQHQLPTDCLKLLNKTSDQIVVRNHYAYSNSSTLNLDYTADIENPSTFSPLFTQAFTTRLASKLAIPVLGSVSKAGQLYTDYTLILKRKD